MVVNDNAGTLTPSGALRFFASKLAPTGEVNQTNGIVGGLCFGAPKPIPVRILAPHSVRCVHEPARIECLCHRRQSR
ncbi:hypothetical protein BZ163_32600 [Pseudomonas sp. VI4.1]|nr:hypothetical protein BZ163_32600 [Pseudomonas sp. VI4.1]